MGSVSRVRVFGNLARNNLNRSTRARNALGVESLGVDGLAITAFSHHTFNSGETFNRGHLGNHVGTLGNRLAQSTLGDGAFQSALAGSARGGGVFSSNLTGSILGGNSFRRDLTGSALNVQSLLGFIFIIGIKVANTVLMTDCAQELRRNEGLSPLEAIRKAASLRVRPVTMTALAAFFAMIPTALALENGSEANAPLARAILGGLLAGEPATLFVLPALYAVLVRDKKVKTEGGDSALPSSLPTFHH